MRATIGAGFGLISQCCWPPGSLVLIYTVSCSGSTVTDDSMLSLVSVLWRFDNKVVRYVLEDLVD